MTLKTDHHPEKSDANEANGANAKSEVEAATESIAAPMDPMTRLQADLTAARSEVAEWQDRFLRKAAELENFRKRAEKEKTDSMILAKSSVFLEFLPIADACERAIKSIGDAESPSGGLEQYQAGFQLLYRQVLDALARLGVVPIEAEGKTFDPHLHEALSREETPDFEEDTVTEELRRGYLFRGRLLRPAQVRVAVRPPEKEGV